MFILKWTHNLTWTHTRHSCDISSTSTPNGRRRHITLRKEGANISVFLPRISLEFFFQWILFSALKTMFEIWAHTTCLTFYFNDKSFFRHILTNEPSYHFCRSDIPLVRNSICRNTFFSHLSTLYSSAVWKLNKSASTLFIKVHIASFWKKR